MRQTAKTRKIASNLTYRVHRGVLGKWPIMRVSQQEFEMVWKAKHDIFLLLGMEEKFGMVIDNYLEFEREMLALTLLHMAAASLDWSSFQDSMVLANRRLANCLTVARLYLDQIRHDLKEIYGPDGPAVQRVVLESSKQYDRLLGYRVMESLRNVLQHRALPVTGLSYPSTWEDRKRGERLHFGLKITLDPVRLREGGGVKKSVLEEIESGVESKALPSKTIPRNRSGVANTRDRCAKSTLRGSGWGYAPWFGGQVLSKIGVEKRKSMADSGATVG